MTYDNPVQAAYDNLTDAQKALADEVLGYGGALRDVLVRIVADTRDKAAVAEYLGGPGAGAEFLNGTVR